MHSKKDIVAVVGHARSGVGYIFNLVYKILDTFSKVDDYTKNFDLPKQIIDVRNVYAVEVKFSQKDTQNITLSYCCDGFTHETKQISAMEFAQKSNLFFTHSKVGDVCHNVLHEKINHVIFCYRDCRDYLVSNIKYICLNNDNDAVGYAREKNNMMDKSLYYTSLGAFTKYNILDTDMARCIPILKFFSLEWRRYMCDYFMLKEIYPIHIVPFENRYIYDGNKELLNLLKLFDLGEDALVILNIGTKDFGYVESQKIGKYHEFFSKEDKNLIEQICGDMLVCLGYMSLEEYSKYLYTHDNFICIVHCLEFNEAEIQKIFCMFGKKIKKIIYANPNSYAFNKHDTYLLFTKEVVRVGQSICYDYYPYYKPHIHQYLTFFNIMTKEILPLHALKCQDQEIDILLCPSAIAECALLEEYQLVFQKIDSIILDNGYSPIGKTVVLLTHNMDVLVKYISFLSRYSCTILSMYPLFEYDKYNKNKV